MPLLLVRDIEKYLIRQGLTSKKIHHTYDGSVYRRYKWSKNIAAQHENHPSLDSVMMLDIKVTIFTLRKWNHVNLADLYCNKRVIFSAEIILLREGCDKKQEIST